MAAGKVVAAAVNGDSREVAKARDVQCNAGKQLVAIKNFPLNPLG